MIHTPHVPLNKRMHSVHVSHAYVSLTMRCPAGMPHAGGGALPFPPVASSWQAGISRSVESLAHLTQLKHLQLRFICGERGECPFSNEGLLVSVQLCETCR
jgi:hypothetical protein